MSPPMEKTPAELWLDILGGVGTALTARPVMKGGKNFAERDGATRVYVEAVDRLVETLELMAQRRYLDDVGAFLDAQFGRV